jgi:hypothetical protein
LQQVRAQPDSIHNLCIASFPDAKPFSPTLRGALSKDRYFTQQSHPDAMNSCRQGDKYRAVKRSAGFDPTA